MDLWYVSRQKYVVCTDLRSRGGVLDRLPHDVKENILDELSVPDLVRTTRTSRGIHKANGRHMRGRLRGLVAEFCEDEDGGGHTYAYRSDRLLRFCAIKAGMFSGVRVMYAMMSGDMTGAPRVLQVSRYVS